MNLIVAVDKNWGIGKNNDLLISLKDDMRFFREKTKDSVVIMGQNTLESFPGGNPLKNRVNIVLTLDQNYVNEYVIVARNISQAVEMAKKYNKEIFIIGGASIYRQMLDLCDTAYVTKIDKSFDADTFFTNLDELSNWSIENETEILEENGIKYKFVVYHNKE